MNLHARLIPSNAWHTPSELMPQPMMPVLATDGNGVVIAVWHKSMGLGGDFAAVTKRGRITTLNHLPGVTHWTDIPKIPEEGA